MARELKDYTFDGLVDNMTELFFGRLMRGDFKGWRDLIWQVCEITTRWAQAQKKK
jgi:hypothetical protein